MAKFPTFERCKKKEKKPKKPKQLIMWLHKLAVRLEKIQFLNRLRKLDNYGLAGGPKGRGRTIVGGIVSVIFVMAIVAMNVVNLVQLLQGQRSLTASHSISLNPKEDVGFRAYGIFRRTGVELDFPVLDFWVANELIFFEKDNPSIQKILVLDNTHYNPSFATNFTDPPVTRSVYTQVSVPFNSVELNLPDSNPPIILNVNRLLDLQLPRKFSQDIQTMELIKTYKAFTSYSFYPHNVSVYARFNRQQLKQLLDNQLDVAIYNKGEWNRAQIPELFSNLSTLTTDSTLHNITTADPNFNVLVLRAYLDRDMSDDADSVNWNIGIQYTPNFNYTLGDFYCYDNLTNTLNVSTFNVSAWIVPPRSGDITLEVAKTSYIWNMPKVPFSILIANQIYTEKAIVIFVEGNTLHLQSPIEIDFYAYTSQCKWDTSDPLSGHFLLLPLPSTLASVIYSNFYRQSVDAKFWYHQQWCECYEGTPNLYCMLCQAAQQISLETYGHLCDLNGNSNITTLQPSLVPITMTCEYGVPAPAGSTVISGLFSEPAPNSILQCPEDEYYGGEALNLDWDTSNWCNYKPQVQLMLIDGQFWVFKFDTRPITHFTGSLAIGLVQYNDVDATIWFDDVSGLNVVNISGIPGPQACGSSPSALPTSAIGSLFSPLNPGEVVMWLETPDSGNFLPTAGPYNIVIESFDTLGNNFTYQDCAVASAECPNTEGLQMIVLQQPLPLALVENIRAAFLSTTIYELAISGSQYIKIYNNPDIMKTVCALITANINPALAIGSDNVHMFRAWVVTVNDESSSCCAVDSCLSAPEPLTLKLKYPLPYTLLQGTKVYSKGETLVPIVAHLPLLLAEATSEDNLYVYEARDRYRFFPVPNLDIEIAAFVVPQKKGFTEFPKLCENKPSNSTCITGVWNITEDRQMVVQDCNIFDASAYSGICVEYGCDANDVMQPTRVFNFTQFIPANNKWTKNELFNSVGSPEYSIDTSTVYYFDYTENDLQTGNQFSAKTEGQGDYDQYSNKLEFSGEMDFIGRSSSNNTKFSRYPANAPILNFRLQLIANTSATLALMDKYGEAFKGVWKAIGWTPGVVEKFIPITISWPNALPLTLQPGFNYTFKAIITLQPNYDIGILGGSDLREWRSSVDTTFERVNAGLNNQATVRLIIEFSRDTSVLENRVIYTFFDFVASVGSSIGLLGIGLATLTLWQLLTISVEVLETEISLNDANPYTDPIEKLPRSRAASNVDKTASADDISEEEPLNSIELQNK